jgi:hypothetical protein
MASLMYNSALDDALRGNIDFDTDSFRAMLVTSSYSPNKDTHTKRSDVTNEVGASGSYAAGGGTATVTVTKDTVNDRIDISLGAVSSRRRRSRREARFTTRLAAARRRPMSSSPTSISAPISPAPPGRFAHRLDAADTELMTISAKHPFQSAEGGRG